MDGQTGRHSKHRIEPSSAPRICHLASVFRTSRRSANVHAGSRQFGAIRPKRPLGNCHGPAFVGFSIEIDIGDRRMGTTMTGPLASPALKSDGFGLR